MKTLLKQCVRLQTDTEPILNTINSCRDGLYVCWVPSTLWSMHDLGVVFPDHGQGGTHWPNTYVDELMIVSLLEVIQN